MLQNHLLYWHCAKKFSYVISYQQNLFYSLSFLHKNISHDNQSVSQWEHMMEGVVLCTLSRTHTTVSFIHAHKKKYQGGIRTHETIKYVMLHVFITDSLLSWLRIGDKGVRSQMSTGTPMAK